jgi:hypothetical protein
MFAVVSPPLVTATAGEVGPTLDSTPSFIM